MQHQKGFTLIELMIVVIVIGIIAAVAIPNFMAMREKAEYGTCLSNQRNIVQGATLYAIEQGINDMEINVSVLEPGGYVNNGLTECPKSWIADLDDYTVLIEDSRVHNISCDVFTSDHKWRNVPR